MIRRRHLSAALAVAVSLVAAAPVAGPPDDDRIRRELDQVFQLPEFNPESANPWLWLLRALAEFFAWLGRLSGQSPILFWLIIFVCVGLLLLISGHIAWTVYRTVHGGPRWDDAGHLAHRRRQLSAQFRADAEEQARLGEYTGAVRLLFLSLVHTLDESGKLLFRSALTNREYLQHFADQPSIREYLGFFVDLLDTNWYGQRPTQAADYAHCLALYDNLRRVS